MTNNGAAAGSVLSFAVPASAPETLFYQCSFHEPMGGQLNVVAPAAAAVPSFGPVLAVALAGLLLMVAAAMLRRRQSAIAAMRDSDQ